MNITNLAHSLPSHLDAVVTHSRSIHMLSQLTTGQIVSLILGMIFFYLLWGSIYGLVMLNFRAAPRNKHR